jgi:hypothetical protein
MRSGRTRDGLALNRRPWLPFAVIVALAAFLGMLALFIWAEGNHNALASNLSGAWSVREGAGGPALTIESDRRSKAVGFLAPDLVFEGTLDGQSVGGKIDLPTFPPWESTIRARLLGEVWTLHAAAWPHVLTMVSESGWVIRFTHRR